MPSKNSETYLKFGFDAAAAEGTRRSAKLSYMSSMHLKSKAKLQETEQILYCVLSHIS